MGGAVIIMGAASLLYTHAEQPWTFQMMVVMVMVTVMVVTVMLLSLVVKER